jgi:peptidoglycan/xylan/chitin deacetylase (PgdA/CDA1 family)
MRDVPDRLRSTARRGARVLGSVVAVQTSEPLVVLTYDDGPEPGGTEPILNALADARATATFFVLLTRARRYPALLAEVVAAGHEIGFHGVDHRPLVWLSREAVRRTCTDGRTELEDRVGGPVRWMRPPYGRQTPATWSGVRSSGFVPVLWGPSTADALPASMAVRVHRATSDVRRGAILLAHDGYAGPDDGVDDGPAPVLDRGRLTAEILAAYRARGLGGSSLADALRYGRLYREARFRR